MPIIPLPVFEAEADPRKRGLSEEEIAAMLPPKPPSKVMASFGYQRFVGEFDYRLDVVPNPGTKIVVRTQRGTEIAEVRAHAKKNCDNCPRRVDHRELPESVIRDYVELSGGKQYPYVEGGRVLRIATTEDVARVWELRETKSRPMRNRAQEHAQSLQLEMDFIEAEPILGEEQITFFFMAEGRIDFRELVRLLAADFSTRIELRQVGARDEARITADYERCGQHCCCKQFLKVLKPVSMKSAKMQKATLDPLKISGRCGRLMCCLRYEDDVYRELKTKLPHKKTRVGTEYGPGIVLDTQIITQLVLIELEHDQTQIAVGVDELLDPETCPRPEPDTAKPGAGNGGGRGRRSGGDATGSTRSRTPDAARRGGDQTAEGDAVAEAAEDSVDGGGGGCGAVAAAMERRRRRQQQMDAERVAGDAAGDPSAGDAGGTDPATAVPEAGGVGGRTSAASRPAPAAEGGGIMGADPYDMGEVAEDDADVDDLSGPAGAAGEPGGEDFVDSGGTAAERGSRRRRRGRKRGRGGSDGSESGSPQAGQPAGDQRATGGADSTNAGARVAGDGSGGPGATGEAGDERGGGGGGPDAVGGSGASGRRSRGRRGGSRNRRRGGGSGGHGGGGGGASGGGDGDSGGGGGGPGA